MSQDNHLIAITGPRLPQDVEARLSDLGAQLRQLPGDLTIDKLRESIQGASFYVLGGNECLTEEFFRMPPPGLQQICFMGTGYQGFIDVEAARRAGIEVTYTPFANARSTAEFSIGLLLALRRNVIALANQARSGNWALREERSLFRSNVGVIGFGHVGSSVVQILSMAFGITPLVWNRTDRGESVRRLGGVSSSLEEIFDSCDAIMIHCDWPKDTNQHLIDDRLLDRVQRDVILVNAARAHVVDPGALGRLLDRQPGCRVAFDGFYVEPATAETDSFGLLSRPLEQFVVTPHAAYLTDDANRSMSDMVFANFSSVLAGTEPPYLVPGVA